MSTNELIWINIFLTIIALFLFSFLFLLLIYVIGRLFGYIENKPKHTNPTNTKQTNQNNINNHDK